MLATLFLTGCKQTAIRNVDNGPLLSPSGTSLEQTTVVIRRAGAKLGWQMKSIAPGHILGVLHLRSHVAKVDITFDTKTFNIQYKDSVNLDYKTEDGANTIHSNYNGWIHRLVAAIMSQTSDF
ncbi:hypothetical protein [Candidatus Vondammii sp. HM_W22]|uniref:hypothetical protein n=1 Tax=Candidatus Vondammii sp. HM_W22 TaxID=2687299 RepID=UPI001F12936C|nr:hypothetical protein [Candidatus Vondammii sp. HM_W22]